MLRTIIIDDEAHVRVTLKRFLKRYCPEVQLVAEAESVISGLKAITKYHPDLILLDIKMDDGTGFDLLEAVDNVDFKIIFITAYEKYAIKAFKFSAVDYILKPVNPEELAKAVKRAGEVKQDEYNIRLEALGENMKLGEDKNKKIILKTQDNIYLTNVKDITYCESDGCYTRFHTAEGEKILVSKTLKEYDELFKENGFFRIHKSYLINLRYIKRFEKQDGGYVVLPNDKRIPVASRKKDELLDLFKKLAD